MRELNTDVVLDCPFCGRTHWVTVNSRDFADWRNFNVLTQNAFPYLSATEREQLISGLCPECQKGVFGGE